MANKLFSIRRPIRGVRFCPCFCLTLIPILVLTFASARCDLVRAATLVPSGAVWTWTDGRAEASSPTGVWRLTGFDDADWARGRAPLHYGDGVVGGTVIEGMRGNYLSVFMRRAFHVEDVDAVGDLVLRAAADDGFVAWINGVEVARFNMPDGAVRYNSTALVAAPENPRPTNEYRLPPPNQYLTGGANQFAVQVFQNQINSSDLFFDGALESSEPDRIAPRLLTVTPAPGVVNELTEITVQFSEPVTGVGAPDLRVNDRAAIALTGAGDTYTFQVDPPPAGAVTVNWDSDTRITDFATPANPFDHTGSGASWTYELVDDRAPGIAGILPVPGITIRDLQSIEIRFDEAVTGLDPGDLRIRGGPATAVNGEGQGPYVFEFDSLPDPGEVEVSWDPAHGITDLASPPNMFEGGAWSYTLDPDYRPPNVRINELMAANRSGLTDEDGDRSDWIELVNLSDSTVDLNGWSLTDDPGNPDRWVFSSFQLAPGQHRVVFASAKNRVPTGTGGRWHTNFRLGSAGESVGLYNAESPRKRIAELSYPEQRNDHSFGYIVDGETTGFFAAPTPERRNGANSITGVLAPVHFSVGRGWFDRAFELHLTHPVSGVQIRYTVDGSEPTSANGRIAAGPIAIGASVIVRAAAFRAGLLPSVVGTHSYLFLEQAARQPANPAGFPVGAVWSGFPADYEMDPAITRDIRNLDRIRAAFLSLPVVSIAADVDDLFGGRTGIYTHPTSRGDAWEKPCSVEWIEPTGETLARIDCGIQMQGNANREPQKQPKHSFRLVFKGEYGPGKLEAGLFPDSPVERFNTLVLRGDFNNSWLHWASEQRARGQRTRDGWMKRSMRDMGGLASHNRYLHLFLNGLYWGVYDATERPDAEFGAAYLGGDPAEYDVVNEGQVKDGSGTAYQTMLGLGNLANTTQYERMRQYLDVTQFIDYMLLHFYAANHDWGQNKNWYTLRRRAPGEGFRYVPWDGERILEGIGADVTGSDVSGLHAKLVANPEYRLAFADRAHRHLFDDGALTPGQTAHRWRHLAGIVDDAIVAESARWGDYRRDVHSFSSGPYQLYTYNDHFVREQNRLLNDYFPRRTSIVLGQLRADGLYPNVAAPQFNRTGGVVPRGFALTMTAPAGTVYYTLDGSDPRVPGSGAVSGAARRHVEGGSISLTDSVIVKARTRSGSIWSAAVEAVFTVGDRLPPLRITEIMYHPVGDDPFEFIELRNEGGVALDVGGFSLTGIGFVFAPGTSLPPAGTVVLASDSSPAAFAERYPGLRVDGFFSGNLSNSGERVSVRDTSGRTVVSVDYRDSGSWPAAADGGGYSLEIIDPFGNPDDPANWGVGANVGGSPGRLDSPAVESPISIHELMADNAGAVEHLATFPDWIELLNTSDEPVSLAGWSLTDGVDPRKFVFPDGVTLGSGEFLIVWADNRTSSDAGAGVWHAGFALNRRGETIRLFDSAGVRMDAVSFGVQVANRSLGRINVAGAAEWALCDPTPGAANRASEIGSVVSLRINEWLANPAPGMPDWIELLNTDPELVVPLRGVFLTNGEDEFRYQSLSFLPPAGFLQLFADRTPGVDRVDFRLPAAGGAIELLDPAGAPLDRVEYAAQAEGASAGRFPDGTAEFRTFAGSASPGAPNYVPENAGPFLNEIMTWSSGETAGGTGTPGGWVELVNPTGEPVALEGIGIGASDGSRESGPGWTFPADTVIEPGGVILVHHDPAAPPSTTLEPRLQSGVSLPRRGGTVVLHDPQGRILDTVRFGPQPVNRSIGRFSDGWTLLDTPTPGRVGGVEATLGDGTEVRINEWFAGSGPAGADWFELYNPSPLPVALGGWRLTDDPSVQGSGRAQIPPLTFVDGPGWVRWTAGGNAGVGDQVGFRLNVDGDSLLLFDSAGALIDARYFGRQIPGYSEGRFPDGAAETAQFPVPSPGGPNRIVVDSDGDGIADDWELANGLDPESGDDALMDFDRDGMNALEEYLAGTDPRDPDSLLMIHALEPELGGIVRMRFRAARGRAYRVEYRDVFDDQPWRILEDIGAESVDREVTIEDGVPGHDARFYRVRLMDEAGTIKVRFRR